MKIDDALEIVIDHLEYKSEIVWLCETRRIEMAQCCYNDTYYILNVGREDETHRERVAKTANCALT